MIFICLFEITWRTFCPTLRIRRVLALTHTHSGPRTHTHAHSMHNNLFCLVNNSNEMFFFRFSVFVIVVVFLMLHFLVFSFCYSQFARSLRSIIQVLGGRRLQAAVAKKSNKMPKK